MKEMARLARELPGDRHVVYREGNREQLRCAPRPAEALKHSGPGLTRSLTPHDADQTTMTVACLWDFRRWNPRGPKRAAAAAHCKPVACLPLTSFGRYARAKANNVAVAPMTNIMFAVAPIAKA